MMMHLHQEYGQLADDDIDINIKKMKAAINIMTHFEMLVAQIEDCQEAVSIQQLYTNLQVVSIARNLVWKTGF